jgi:hypothetical protein
MSKKAVQSWLSACWLPPDCQPQPITINVQKGSGYRPSAAASNAAATLTKNTSSADDAAHKQASRAASPMLACWLFLCYWLPPTCQPRPVTIYVT